MDSILKGALNIGSRLFSLQAIFKAAPTSYNSQSSLLSNISRTCKRNNMSLLPFQSAKSQFSTSAISANYKLTEKFDYINAKHLQGPLPNRINRKNPLGAGVNMVKAVVIRPVIKKPRKPNSANRKCVLVRIPKDGREMVAFIPGEGHNLQEHSIVMIRPGKLRDCSGVKVRCVRGCYDLPHIVKSTNQ